MFKVVNENEDLDFEGKGREMEKEKALDLYEQLGGYPRGFDIAEV